MLSNTVKGAQSSLFAVDRTPLATPQESIVVVVCV